MEKIQCEKCNKKFKSEDSLNHHNKAKHSSQNYEKPKLPLNSIILYSVLGILVIAVLFFSINSKSQSEYNALNEDTEHVKGSINATVEIIKYSDFQCPACKQATDVVDELFEEYEGKIKFTYRHFPLTSIHEFAFKAAEASECASDQGKFWEYHDILFERQPALNINNLKKYASDIGLNRTLFDSCLDSGFMIKRVNTDFDEGKKNVRSTPTFFVNGKKVEGVSQLKRLIESELNDKSKN